MIIAVRAARSFEALGREISALTASLKIAVHEGFSDSVSALLFRLKFSTKIN